MEKTINIDSLHMMDVINRIHYNEEDIIDIIEGLAEAASSLCHYDEDKQMSKLL